MDPLSLTCNITAVLTVTAQLISAGYSYGSSVAAFPGEVQELMAELTSLSGILSALRAIVDQPYDSADAQPSLIAKFLSSPLEECGKRLQSVLQSLQNQNEGNKMKKLFKRVTWPLKEEETKDLLAGLERYKKTFSLALSADEITLTRSIYNDIGAIRKRQTEEAQKKRLATKNEMFWKIIRWLSPADPEVNHAAARELQQSGTGKWFTEGEAFRDWFSPDHSFLWLHGKPGAGKTILSSIIIDRVVSEVYKSSNIAPAAIYFYCDFKDSLKQTAIGLFGSLIAQLVQKMPKIPDDLENLYYRSDNGNKPPDIYYLEECLRSIIKGFSKVVVVIDAFDECVERDLVFERLERLQGKINLLITSRDELDIKLHFEAFPSLLINENDVTPDIERFVTSELNRHPKLNRLKPSTKSDIIFSLVKGANGMFRWAKCCLDDIAKLRNDKAIKSALKSLPKTLESSYERTLCNIPEEDKALAIRIFHWLLASQRPMKVWEMVDAIAVEIGDESMDPDSKLNEPEDITNICGGLVDLNRWDMTLGLAHFTVVEYLTSIAITQSPAATYQIQPQIANAEVTKVCLTYILFDNFSVGLCETEDEFLTRLDEYPLLCYAPYHWPEHIRGYKSGTDKTLDDLILSFFRLEQDSGKFLSWMQIRGTGPNHKPKNLNDYKHSLIKPFYFAAEMGQLMAVRDLFESGADVNEQGGPLGTPLVAAASNGHSETVKFLLENGAGLEDGMGLKEHKPLHKPLSRAASHGSAECVQILLDYGVEEPSDWIKCCENAMGYLSIDGEESVMGVFLATDYFQQVPSAKEAGNPNRMHPFLSAFAICVHHGWEKHIRSLWEMGCDVLVSANEYKMLKLCLQTATMYGHVKILRIILQNDEAKAYCAKNGIYQMLLQEAAYYGQGKIVEFLLGFGKSSGDENIGLSLHVAAAKGQIDIMDRLLRAGANPLERDDDRWPPLIYAAQYHENHATEKLSALTNFVEISDIKLGPTSWDLSPKEASVDGAEIKAKIDCKARALHPISPLCDNYSFEVEVVKSACSIGFADALYSLTLSGEDMFERISSRSDMSWAYSRHGRISFEDRDDTQSVERYGVGDIVGCHFDRIKALAFFTVNGRIMGKPIANVKGKLVPQIYLEEGAHVRTNFGESPLAYPMPSLSTEMLSDIWTPSDAWWSVGLEVKPPKPLV